MCAEQILLEKNNVCSREVINKKDFFRGTETGATVQGLDRKQQIVYITRVSIITTGKKDDGRHPPPPK